MESLHELFRIGRGPSSSHTMGPAAAGTVFKKRFPDAVRFQITLFGSLAATGKGHLTEEALLDIFPPEKSVIVWDKKKSWPQHPNALLFEADIGERKWKSWLVFSVGGGAIRDLENWDLKQNIYSHNSLAEIGRFCQRQGITLSDYVFQTEGESLAPYLKRVWRAMKLSLERGLQAEGVLPGPLKLARKAATFLIKSKNSTGVIQKISRSFAYALAVAEENAAGGEIVTAPTCGSSGVLPAVLKYLEESYRLPEIKVLSALAVAGLIGNLIKENASISGAEVGCQGEIGAACSMAAAAAAYILGGSSKQIEYAAEMGLEHHLGLTCDPVAGLVQIPCIERNAMAAERAMDCAVYAIQTDGTHKIPFDKVVKIMKQTGHDLKHEYRETSRAGLAGLYKKQPD